MCLALLLVVCQLVLDLCTPYSSVCVHFDGSFDDSFHKTHIEAFVVMGSGTHR